MTPRTTNARKSAAPVKASKPAVPKPAAKSATVSAAKPMVKPAPKPVRAAAPAKPKHKLVRDSFTIPKAEYTVLEGLKLRAANLTRPTKKSELLRAGISALNAMSDKAFLAALSGVPSLKTGRPKATEVDPGAAKKTR